MEKRTAWVCIYVVYISPGVSVVWCGATDLILLLVSLPDDDLTIASALGARLPSSRLLILGQGSLTDYDLVFMVFEVLLRIEALHVSFSLELVLILSLAYWFSLTPSGSRLFLIILSFFTSISLGLV